MKKVVFFSFFLMLILSSTTQAEIEIQEKFILETPEKQEVKSGQYLIIPKSYYDSLKDKQNIQEPFRLPFTVKIDNISDNAINLYHFYNNAGQDAPKNITKFIVDQNQEHLQAKNIEYHEIHGIPTLSPPPLGAKGEISFDIEIPLTDEILYQDADGTMQVSIFLAKHPLNEKEQATVSFLLARNEFTFEHDIKFDIDGNPQMFLDIFNNNTMIHVYANSLDPILIEKNASEGARNAILFLKKDAIFKLALKIVPEFPEENLFITYDYLANETQFITYEFKKFDKEEEYNQAIEEIEQITISGSKLLREILQAIHEKINRSVNYEDGKGISIQFEQGDSIEEFTQMVYQAIRKNVDGAEARVESPKYIILYNKNLNTREFRISESTMLKQKEDVLNRYNLQPDKYPTAIKELEQEIEEIKQSLVEHEGKFFDPDTIQDGSIVYFPVNSI